MSKVETDLSAVFVLSLLLNTAGDPDRYLFGVRRHARTSRRHPGVVSTPTMRLPAEFLPIVGTAIDTSRIEGSRYQSIDQEGEVSAPIGVEKSLGYPLAFVVESLLARKLELSDQLVSGTLSGSCRRLLVASAVVHDEQGGDIPEMTTMLTAHVTIDSEIWLPAQTKSYSRFIWSGLEQVGVAVEANDALIIDDTLDPFEVCVDGLCLASAVHYFGSKVGAP